MTLTFGLLTPKAIGSHLLNKSNHPLKFDETKVKVEFVFKVKLTATFTFDLLTQNNKVLLLKKINHTVKFEGYELNGIVLKLLHGNNITPLLHEGKRGHNVSKVSC